MNDVQLERPGAATVALFHAGVTVYRLPDSDPALDWSFTTCAECANRTGGAARPHAFDVRRLPRSKRIDLESCDAHTRRATIAEILRRGMESGDIAPRRCETRRYVLDFAVPNDTVGSYVRAIFALYGWPRAAADAFFADVSLAIGTGRFDLLISEHRLVENALDAAVRAGGCDAFRDHLAAELTALLRGA